jgi:hypothetical protein
MKIYSQALFPDVSTTSASLTSLKKNLFFTLVSKLCGHYANGFDRNVGSVYFFYSNPVFAATFHIWRHKLSTCLVVLTDTLITGHNVKHVQSAELCKRSVSELFRG